jgi:hypothetical protein
VGWLARPLDGARAPLKFLADRPYLRAAKLAAGARRAVHSFMDVWKAYKAQELTRLQPPASIARTASDIAEGSRGSRAHGRAAPADTTTSVAISRPAELLKRLSALQQSDATKFKHLLGELGSNLKAAANSPSGVVGAELGQLADRVLRAAKTGDLSGLQGEPGAPPPKRAVAAPSSSAASAAIAAYRRNAPAVAAPSVTVAQALDYVLSAVDEASR